MHALSGLLELGRPDEALQYLNEIRGTTADLDNTLRTHIGAPMIIGLLLGKAAEANERGIELVIAPDTDLGEAPDRVQALTTILGNLIDNAFDALAGAPAPRRTVVSVVESPQSLTVRVSDNGPGVQSAEVPRIFTNGYTTKQGSAVRHSGLGLSLVHSTVAKLGGTVTVSEGPGAAFTVVLPRNPDPVEWGDGVSDDSITVLVVDDDFRVAGVHVGFVEAVPGFRVVGTAHTAADARTLAAALRPDLVLMDVYLPDEDGLEVVRTLLADPAPPAVLMISAANDLGTVRRAVQLGALHYLVKPFGFAELAERLTAFRRAQDDLARFPGSRDPAGRRPDLRPAATGDGRPGRCDPPPRPDAASRLRRRLRQRSEHLRDRRRRRGRRQPDDRAAGADPAGAERRPPAGAAVRDDRSPRAPLRGQAGVIRPPPAEFLPITALTATPAAVTTAPAISTAIVTISACAARSSVRESDCPAISTSPSGSL